MKNIFLIFLFCSTSYTTFAGNGYEAADSVFVSSLEATPNYINKDESLNYSVYSLKHKKDWVLIMTRGYDVSVYIVDHKTEETVPASNFFKYGVEQLMLNGKVGKKNKSKKIADLNVSDYYELKGKSKKVLKNLLLIELDEIDKKKK